MSETLSLDTLFSIASKILFLNNLSYSIKNKIVFTTKLNYYFKLIKTVNSKLINTAFGIFHYFRENSSFRYLVIQLFHAGHILHIHRKMAVAGNLFLQFTHFLLQIQDFKTITRLVLGFLVKYHNR